VALAIDGSPIATLGGQTGTDTANPARSGAERFAGDECGGRLRARGGAAAAPPDAQTPGAPTRKWEEAPAGEVRAGEVEDFRQRANRAMERYADGDDGAFAELYDLLEPRLRSLALSAVGSRDVADDLIQTTFARLFETRASFVRGAPVLPWAYAIARNLLRDWLRHRGHETRHASDVAPPEPIQSALEELVEDRRRIAAVLGFLRHEVPENLREPFLLVAVEGLSVAETADVCGITPGNVKVRVHRARQMLRDFAARPGGQDP
jgi:RNA polymerase sigma-70 factor (ECF subfamily)